jgi:hypothetical protein
MVCGQMFRNLLVGMMHAVAIPFIGRMAESLNRFVKVGCPG